MQTCSSKLLDILVVDSRFLWNYILTPCNQVFMNVHLVERNLNFLRPVRKIEIISGGLEKMKRKNTEKDDLSTVLGWNALRNRFWDNNLSKSSLLGSEPRKHCEEVGRRNKEGRGRSQQNTLLWGANLQNTSGKES